MKLKEAHYAETIHILIPNQLETWIKMGGSGELEEGDIPEQVWDTFKNKIANWIKTRRPELKCFLLTN